MDCRHGSSLLMQKRAEGQMTLGAWFPLIKRCSGAGKVLVLLALLCLFCQAFFLRATREDRHVTKPPAGNRERLRTHSHWQRWRMRQLWGCKWVWFTVGEAGVRRGFTDMTDSILRMWCDADVNSRTDKETLEMRCCFFLFICLLSAVIPQMTWCIDLKYLLF